MTLALIREAVKAATADRSNPLIVERSITVRVSAKGRSNLYSEAVDAGFRTFRGCSPRVPMSLGVIPDDAVAECMEIVGSSVVYRRVELTDAGMNAR